MNKPTVLVSVLCGAERTNWVNPLLFDALMTLQSDPRFTLENAMAYSIERVEVARNRAVQYARDNGAGILIMADNDMVPPPNFADILHEVIISGKAIVGFPYARVMAKTWIIEPLTPQGGGGRPDAQFLPVGVIGGGLMILSSEVWRVIPRGPWFRWLCEDDEVLSRKLGEDYFFSELARERGLTLWSHRSIAGHLKTCDITKQETRKEPL